MSNLDEEHDFPFGDPKGFAYKILELLFVAKENKQKLVKFTSLQKGIIRKIENTEIPRQTLSVKLDLLEKHKYLVHEDGPPGPKGYFITEKGSNYLKNQNSEIVYSSGNIIKNTESNVLENKRHQKHMDIPSVNSGSPLQSQKGAEPLPEHSYNRALYDSFRLAKNYYKEKEPSLIKGRKCKKMDLQNEKYIETKKILLVDGFLSEEKKGLIAIMGAMGLGKSMYVMEILDCYFQLKLKRPLFWIELKNGLQKENNGNYKTVIAEACFANLRDIFKKNIFKKEIISDIEKSIRKGSIFILDGCDEYHGSYDILKLLANIKNLGTTILIGREKWITRIDASIRKKPGSWLYDELFRLSYFDDGEVEKYIENFTEWLKNRGLPFHLPNITNLAIWAPHTKAPELSYRNPLVLKALLTKPSKEGIKLSQYDILEKLAVVAFDWYAGFDLDITSIAQDPKIRLEWIPFNEEEMCYNVEPQKLKSYFFSIFHEIALSCTFEMNDSDLWLYRRDRNSTSHSKVNKILNDITKRKKKTEDFEFEHLKTYFERFLFDYTGFLQLAGENTCQILPDRMNDFFVMSYIKTLHTSNDRNDENQRLLHVILTSIMGNTKKKYNFVDMFIEELEKSSELNELSTSLVKNSESLKELRIATTLLNMNWNDKILILILKSFNFSCFNGKVVKLYLSNNNMETFPVEITKLSALKVLRLNGNNIKSFPEEIAKLGALEELKLNSNKVKSFPEEIASLKALRTLILSENDLESLPACIKRLDALENLDLSNNKLKSFPEEIVNLKKLRSLNLSNNNIESIPERIINLKKLFEIDLTNSKIKTFPAEITKLRSLEKLILSNNHIEKFPVDLLEQKDLKILDLSITNLKKFPAEITKLSGLRVLGLSGNYISSIPEGITKLSALKKLDLSRNKLKKFPAEITELNGLKVLDLSHNNIKAIPEVITKLKALDYLVLSFNEIESFPEVIAKLEKLKRVDLGYNKFLFSDNDILTMLKFDARSLYNLADYLEFLECKQQALRIVRDLVKKEPEGNSFSLNGKILMRYGEYEEALDEFKNALKLEPFPEAKTYFKMGQCLYKLEEPQKAMEVIKKGLGLVKENKFFNGNWVEKAKVLLSEIDRS